jgi:hypothetical protein
VLAYERREVGFVVLIVEPCPMPSPEGSHHRKLMEAGARAGLETHAPDNLAVSGARLIFQEKVVIEQREIRRNAKKWFTEMDVDGNLKNGIRIKESTKEIVGREAKSGLEEGGEHHNLICIGCGEVFAGGRTPL